MDWQEIIRTAWMLFSLLLAISGLVYWVINSKMKDDFCEKKDCAEKHKKIDSDLIIYRNGITDDIKEIKDMVKEMRGWFFDYIKLKS